MMPQKINFPWFPLLFLAGSLRLRLILHVALADARLRERGKKH